MVFAPKTVIQDAAALESKLTEEVARLKAELANAEARIDAAADHIKAALNTLPNWAIGAGVGVFILGVAAGLAL